LTASTANITPVIDNKSKKTEETIAKAKCAYLQIDTSIFTPLLLYFI